MGLRLMSLRTTADPHRVCVCCLRRVAGCVGLSSPLRSAMRASLCPAPSPVGALLMQQERGGSDAPVGP